MFFLVALLKFGSDKYATCKQRDCHGTVVVTKDGVFVNGYKRTLDVPADADRGFHDLVNIRGNTTLSVERGKHPKSGKAAVVFRINEIAVFYAYNNSGTTMVPCK